MIDIDDFIQYYYGIYTHFKQSCYDGTKYHFKIPLHKCKLFRNYDKTYKSLSYIIKQFNAIGMDAKNLKLFFIIIFGYENNLSIFNISKNYHYYLALFRKRRTHLMFFEQHLEEQLVIIKKKYDRIDEIIHNCHGDLPIIVDMVNTNVLSYETYMIIDSVMDVTNQLNSIYGNNIVWVDLRQKLTKYMTIFGDNHDDKLIKLVQLYFKD